MNQVTVVDAMMGRGKSSAAIRYMNERKDDMCFLYVTPYLSEVDRVCERCDFDEPNSDKVAKSIILKNMLRAKKNIASTHSLFGIMDDEALDLAYEGGYSLIVDEELPVIAGVNVSETDMGYMEQDLISVGEDGRVDWLAPNYTGKFEGYMQVAEAGNLYCAGRSFYEVMNPMRFSPFEEVFLLTYLFKGSVQQTYFDYFGIEYNVVGVEQDADGYYFSDTLDNPPPVNYHDLIRVVGSEAYSDKLNDVGDARTAMSLNWYRRRGKRGKDVMQIRNNLRTFFENRAPTASENRMWTTFKEIAPWIYGPRNRYSTSFLPINLKASNKYRNVTSVAYLANRFLDPNIGKMVATKGLLVDNDSYALSEMIQFIWRSAVRDGKAIDLYLPSGRMRHLLMDWIERVSKGGPYAA